MALYQYEATTVEGFVQQLAVRYLPSGYRYYVSGIVREGKDLLDVDAKILGKYNIDINKWECYQRKRSGWPNLQYLRYRRRFLILCTGPVCDHPFFSTEGEIRDIERIPIRFSGYELTYRGRKVWVRIEREDLRGIRAYFLSVATKRRVTDLVAEIQALPYQPYRSVKFQLYRLVGEINRLRVTSGLLPVPKTAVPARRTILRPFDTANVEPTELKLGESDIND
jgi:hypothetical protein